MLLTSNYFSPDLDWQWYITRGKNNYLLDLLFQRFWTTTWLLPFSANPHFKWRNVKYSHSFRVKSKGMLRLQLKLRKQRAPFQFLCTIKGKQFILSSIQKTNCCHPLSEIQHCQHCCHIKDQTRRNLKSLKWNEILIPWKYFFPFACCYNLFLLIKIATKKSQTKENPQKKIFKTGKKKKFLPFLTEKWVMKTYSSNYTYT